MKYLGVWLGILLMMALGLEVAVRLVDAVYPLERPVALAHTVQKELLAGAWLDGATRFYTYKPNLVGTTYGHPFYVNEWGVRGVGAWVQQKTDEDFRIMVLGDSVTAGEGVAEADRYTNVLERLLHPRYPSKHIEVINLGVEGFETVQEATMLRRMVDVLRPDLVIVGVCRNDTNVTYQHYVPYALPHGRSFLTIRLLDPLYDQLVHAWTHEPTHTDELRQSLDVDSRDWRLFMTSALEISALAFHRTHRQPLALYLVEPDTRASERIREAFLASGFLWSALPAGRYQPVSRFEGHPNAATHRLYAKTLVEMIVTTRLLEVRP